MKLPEIEITVKFKGAKSSELHTIKSSADLYQLFQLMFNADAISWQEEMILICMNQAHKVIGYYRVSHGGTTGTVCDPKVIFTTALNCPGTTAIVLGHNHPSGNLKPSRADEALTAKIKAAGELLDIRLIDHIIYTEEGFYSFADSGLM